MEKREGESKGYFAAISLGCMFILIIIVVVLMFLLPAVMIYKTMPR